MTNKSGKPSTTDGVEIGSWPTLEEMQQAAASSTSSDKDQSRALISAMATGKGMGMGPNNGSANDIRLAGHLSSGQLIVDRHEWRSTVFVIEYLTKIDWKGALTPILDKDFTANSGREDDQANEIKQMQEGKPNELKGRLPDILAETVDYVGLFENAMGTDAMSHPTTTLLLHTMVRIGWATSQFYKEVYGRPRPNTALPALKTYVRIPSFSSYPSGHATQAYMIERALGHVADQVFAGKAMSTKLGDIAESIAENREWAGAHYKSDSRAGKLIADHIWSPIMSNKNFAKLIDDAIAEWNRPIQSGHSFIDHS